MLDFSQYLTATSVVKLIQLMQSGPLTAYEISIQNFRSFVTDYAVLYCMPDTVKALYSALTPEQQHIANFKVSGKDISFGQDVLYQDDGMCGTQEIALTFSENQKSIWYFLNLLFVYRAEIVVDDHATPIQNINFSYSTPNISIPIMTPEGFRTKLLWSYEAYRVVEPAVIRCSKELFTLISKSCFMEFVEFAEAHEDMFDLSILLQNIPGIALEEDKCRLAFNLSHMLDCLVQYEQYQAYLDGLNMGYKYARWQNGVKFKSQDYSQMGRQMGYAKNIKIKRELLKPNNTKIFAKLSEDDNYYRDRLKTLPEDELVTFLRTHLAQSDNLIGEYWVSGFMQICDGSGTLREHEYFDALATIRELEFKAGMDWFKAKIQMLEYNLTYYCGRPYSYLGGLLTFIWEAVYEL